LDGPHFVQTLVFGWLANPQATLEELAQMAARRGVRISAQGLAQRFSLAAATFVQQVLEAAVARLVVAGPPVAIPLLQRFTQVWIGDSTTVSLPGALAEQWAGCGGGHAPGQGSAALKLQVRLEMLTGQLGGPLLQEGRTHDGRTPWQFQALPPGSLRLLDLGYFSLNRLAAWAGEGTYWLTHLEVQTVVCAAATGRRLNLPRWLRRHAHGGGAGGAGATVELGVTVGLRAQVPARLLAIRVSRAEAARRRAAIRREAKRQGQPLSPARLDRAGWTIFITNVPADRLTLEEGLELGRVRWQIELLFKLWKAHGHLDEWRSAHPARILCEVYAKLLALLLQHALLLVACWQYPDRSLFKAIRTIQGQGSHLASVFDHSPALVRAMQVVQRCLAAGCRLNKRRKAPATFQRLLPTNQLP
jgi:hypothetical protein